MRRDLIKNAQVETSKQNPRCPICKTIVYSNKAHCKAGFHYKYKITVIFSYQPIRNRVLKTLNRDTLYGNTEKLMMKLNNFCETI